MIKNDRVIAFCSLLLVLGGACALVFFTSSLRDVDSLSKSADDRKRLIELYDNISKRRTEVVDRLLMVAESSRDPGLILMLVRQLDDIAHERCEIILKLRDIDGKKRLEMGQASRQADINGSK